ncbi:uncharacterized protein LOC135166057 isoform X2 [Diachasmimorpha longicaudata]|uniref:uncharacterized protein LOC135166057 isoform X2 n=1 Tax=Diachasmimorpha longicaudata TaxID=58733 RepID=UPI0030B8C6B1
MAYDRTQIKNFHVCVYTCDTRELRWKKHFNILRSRAVAYTHRHSPNTIVKFNIRQLPLASHISSSSNKPAGSPVSDPTNEDKNELAPPEPESKTEKDATKAKEEQKIESPEETMLENITDKLTDSRTEGSDKTLPKSPSSSEPRRQPGECRLLPVLVDLRSSLETNTNSCTTMSRQSADLSPITEGSVEPKLDINYFQDLCTSDLKTALSRLEDTLKRVDINALTKYSLTLEPSDKYHLLQLISTLVSNLKKAKIDEEAELGLSPSPPPVPPLTRRPRKRGNRHTIGVSSEELASARRWLEQERGPAAVKIIVKPLPPVKSAESAPVSVSQVDSRVSDCWGSPDVNLPRTCDKHIKDAINQKQSLQHKIKDNDSGINIPSVVSPPGDSGEESWEGLEALSPDDDRLSYKFNYMQGNSHDHVLFNGNSKSNKYSVKKTKIKRANTIDIPNYLKMQAEKHKMQSGNGLRRPIDISDKVAWNQFCGPQSMNPPPAIPSFQPKTENDKKFLALINRNTDSHRSSWKDIPPSSAPFKSFNYRQSNSIADKNWKSRFSNIKTTFDKPQSNSSSVSSSPASSVFSGAFPSRRNSRELHGFLKHHEDEPPKFELRNFPKHLEENGDRVAMASRRFSAATSIENIPETRFPQPPPRNPVFSHAATSPFKKFPSSLKSDGRGERASMGSSDDRPVPSSYLPACATGGLLKAKVKMFDQVQSQVPINSQSNSFGHQKSQSNSFGHQKPQNNCFGHQKPLNALNRGRPFNQEEHLDKSRAIQKIEHLYSNNDNRTNGPGKWTNGQNVHEKEVQVDVHRNDHLNNNYQSVAVQTSARSTPKPITPETEVFPVQDFYKPFYSASENPIYVPPALKDVNYLQERKYEDYKSDQLPQLPLVPPDLPNEEIVENQDITPDKIVTRYTAAIATVARSPSPEPQRHQTVPSKAPAPLILQDDMHHILNSVPLKPGQPIVLQDDIQRHNMLQLSLIKRIQGNEEPPEPIIEINNTQDKINIFEEKSHPVPKINVTSPTKSSNPLSFPGNQKSTTIPIDSSDEYLVSCSNRPNRSIVLSKSESWHQLALTGANKPLQHLQVPTTHSHKPPKSSSPMSQRHSRNLETSGSNPNVALKKMEEKVQRYFNNSRGSSGSLDCHQQSSNIKRESRRSFSPKKMPNNLARSHTMPHLFDDTYDVDKAFDNLFEETTRDNRY